MVRIGLAASDWLAAAESAAANEESTEVAGAEMVDAGRSESNSRSSLAWNTGLSVCLSICLSLSVYLSVFHRYCFSLVFMNCYKSDLLRLCGLKLAKC